ncbi:dTDP-glucose 4,6-dehydratase [Streptomyces sp. NPDC047525]|uniref:dTDP-glucose 4,6-dehydratase n=1 Tax=Streptomyces sp. NPDC047525 TaxID=3155264 RepID=UPI00340DCEB0
MRLLVTGAAGFIGSTYVRHLLAGAYGDPGDVRITALDKLTYAGNTANLTDVAGHPGLTFVRGDICDVALLADLLPGHDAVVNFAAESHVDRSIAGADDFVRTNVLGTQTLLSAARAARVPRFVHISTDEVYGSIETGSWTEDCALMANSPYAASKAGADILARSYARTYGMDVSVTRCSNNYGSHQYPEKLIPLFVTNLLEGRDVPLYGDGLCVRDWLHVDDHCRGVQLVLEKGRPGEAYNIGGGEELTNVALTHQLLRACGAGPERITYVPDRPGHDRRYSVDDRKIRELGYAPRVSFAGGLARTVDWYRDNPQWWKPLRQELSAAA